MNTFVEGIYLMIEDLLKGKCIGVVLANLADSATLENKQPLGCKIYLNRLIGLLIVTRSSIMGTLVLQTILLCGFRSNT